MGSSYKPNEAKLRRIQAFSQFSNSENTYKMKADSHGKCISFELDFSFQVVYSFLGNIVFLSHLKNIAKQICFFKAIFLKRLRYSNHH